MQQSSLLSNHTLSSTSSIWDTSSGWDSSADRSSILKDTYDVDITNDMRALELRLESELKEQEEKMWSQPEISSHN